MTGAETTSDGHIIGVVPAAGASTRMGRTKALLDLEGRTFVARAVGALRDGGCAPVYVVTSGDAAVRAEAERSGALVLTNDHPGDGPLTSLRLALRAAGPACRAVAYLPVDFPLVTATDVSILLTEAARSEAPLTLPVHRGKRGHPAIFASRLFDELLDPGLEGGARTVVHRHLAEARLVDFGDPGVVTDVDTPEIYEAVLARS